MDRLEEKNPNLLSFLPHLEYSLPNAREHWTISEFFPLVLLLLLLIPFISKRQVSRNHPVRLNYFIALFFQRAIITLLANGDVSPSLLLLSFYLMHYAYY